mmetsp:Transcript_4025/g.12001  ORF Transcript_4025/g.12001 Transcript_4025/m.12001 type:complete len:201 (+) Transcript_4025:1624-2226(+)
MAYFRVHSLAVSSCLPRSCGGVGARWSGAWRAAVRVRGGASGSAVCGGWRAQATAARTVTAVARAGKADLLVEPRNLGHERVVRVGIGQQRTDRKQHLGDRERGRPLALQDVEADATVAVDVAVVNLRREGHLWRLEGVVGGEVDVQEKDAALIRRLLRAHNGGLPVKEVVAHGARAAGGGRVLGQVLQLLVDALGGSHS